MQALTRVALAAWLLLLAAPSCTSTREGLLGLDLPSEQAPDAARGGPALPATPPADVTDDDPARPDDPGDVAPDASADERDAAVAGCTFYGHHPLEGVPSPGDDAWDGGLPDLFDNPRSPGLPTPLAFEAGVPPFCCTLATPWFCAPLSSSTP
jgi:hypothetical protein